MMISEIGHRLDDVERGSLQDGRCAAAAVAPHLRLSRSVKVSLIRARIGYASPLTRWSGTLLAGVSTRDFLDLPLWACPVVDQDRLSQVETAGGGFFT